MVASSNLSHLQNRFLCERELNEESEKERKARNLTKHDIPYAASYQTVSELGKLNFADLFHGDKYSYLYRSPKLYRSCEIIRDPSITDKYDIYLLLNRKTDEQVGAGRNVRVKTAINIGTGEKVAALTIPLSSQNRKKVAEREARNAAIINDIEGFIHTYHIVTELKKNKIEKQKRFQPLCNCNLLEALDSGNLSFEMRKEIMPKLLRAFDLFHKKGMIHRDVKAKNILVKREVSGVKVFIADLGYSCHKEDSEDKQKIAGNIAGMAPEYARACLTKDKREIEAATSSKLDIWGLGVVFYEMFIGELSSDFTNAVNIPFIIKNRLIAVQTIADLKTGWLPSTSNLLECFLSSMLEPDPASRPSAEKLLETLTRIFWKIK